MLRPVIKIYSPESTRIIFIAPHHIPSHTSSSSASWKEAPILSRPPSIRERGASNVMTPRGQYALIPQGTVLWFSGGSSCSMFRLPWPPSGYRWSTMFPFVPSLLLAMMMEADRREKGRAPFLSTQSNVVQFNPSPPQHPWLPICPASIIRVLWILHYGRVPYQPTDYCGCGGKGRKWREHKMCKLWVRASTSATSTGPTTTALLPICLVSVLGGLCRVAVRKDLI